MLNEDVGTRISRDGDIVLEEPVDGFNLDVTGGETIKGRSTTSRSSSSHSDDDDRDANDDDVGNDKTVSDL